MTLPRSVAEVLSDHVVFEVECIDRMYLNVYVPRLQHAGGLVGYVNRQLGLPVASTAPLAKITDRFAAEMRAFAARQRIPWVDFTRDQRKDDVMREYLAVFKAAGRTEGVLFIGRAQEKTPLFRTEKRRRADGMSYPWIVKATGLVNHFYVYAVDADFGPFFIKFCSYFPYNAKLCVNGNHWAQRQAAAAGIAFEALDNGFAAVADPAALQVIRDNLDAGRPDQVSLIFGRHLIRTGPRATPGRFRTRVITAGVTPSLHAYYKHAVIKQYHKEGRALRTETTINDTRDFRIGKRLTNLPALREVGFSASRRMLRLERLSHDPIAGTTALTAVTEPVYTSAGTRIPGLPLGAGRSHALLAALLIFRLQPAGFTSRDLRELTAQLRGIPAVTTGQVTYDLRRLRSHQLIAKIPRSHRYRVTTSGLHTAMVI